MITKSEYPWMYYRDKKIGDAVSVQNYEKSGITGLFWKDLDTANYATG